MINWNLPKGLTRYSLPSRSVCSSSLLSHCMNTGSYHPDQGSNLCPCTGRWLLNHRATQGSPKCSFLYSHLLSLISGPYHLILQLLQWVTYPEQRRNKGLEISFLVHFEDHARTISYNLDLIPSLVVKHWSLSHCTEHRSNFFDIPASSPAPWPTYLVFSITSSSTQGCSV